MYLFTTTTVINKLSDFTTGEALVTVTGETGNKILNIKRVNPFAAKHIVDVIHTTGHAGTNDVVKIPLAAYISSEKVSTDVRIGLYIRSVGNADPMYANNLVFKGKPLYIEIPKGTAKNKIAEVANKYMNLVFGGVELLNATMDTTTDTTLVLTAINEYLRVTKVTLAVRGTNDLPTGRVEKNYSFGDGDEVSGAVTAGHEGFGTSDLLLKDLRLPTGANLRWKRTMLDEMPEEGLYDEFVLTYCKPRGIMGLSAVGSEVTSKTTHVFWVKNSLATTFAEYLRTAGLSQGTPQTKANSTVTVYDHTTTSAD